MSKITLLYIEHSSFTAPHLLPYWRSYFNVEPLDTNKTYNPAEVVLVNKHLNDTGWHQPWVDNGFKVIIDNFWDNDVYCANTRENNILTARAPNWAWFNESLWYKDLNYDLLPLRRNVSKFLLTLMRLQKPHRTQLYNRIKQYADHSLISYTSNNVFIKGDIDIADNLWQRHVDVDWYNSTALSLVAETMTESPLFMSEKTFKPMAFKQPFVVWGSAGTLEYLHKHGFETFDHIVDESYDSESGHMARLNLIVEQVEQLHRRFTEDPNFFSDSITLSKLEHNFNHFYDQALMEKMLHDEIINPILEFVESK